MFNLILYEHGFFTFSVPYHRCHRTVTITITGDGTGADGDDKETVWLQCGDDKETVGNCTVTVR